MAHSSRFFNVVLVIIFRHVELLSHLHLCGNWFVELFLLFLDEFLSDLQLILIDGPNSTSILSAIVGPLSVHLSWIVHHEESFEELSECNELRVVYDSDRLCMHGIALANLAVVWIICSPLLIPGVC